MSLLSEADLHLTTATSQHTLQPIVETIRKKRVTLGWKCRDCEQTWDELPPIAERMSGCV